MTTKTTVSAPPEPYEALKAEAQQVGLAIHQYASQILSEALQHQEPSDDN